MKNVNMKAFNEFYKKNKRGIYQYIFQRTHDAMASEELLNDVFIKVYNSIESYDESKSAFKTWVYNIAKNATIDFLRKKRVQVRSMQDVIIGFDGESQEMDFESTDENPLESLISGESESRIKEAISKLPKMQAEVLRQYAVGYSYEDIAKELDMPIGTVKGSMHVARIRMREFFNNKSLALA